MPASVATVAVEDQQRPVAEPRSPRHRERLVFLDALRGFALVFMVLNHTGRWWQDRVMGWPRYYGIYVTMAIAAPIFLFLVGFCVPLSGRREGRRSLAVLGTYAARGARLVLAGLLLNLLVFPEDPIYSNGVLQTIGLGVIVAGAGGLVLRHRGMRWTLLAVAVLGYLAYGWLFADLTAWVAAHSTAARVLFFEFPPWPWVSLVLVGLVLGDAWVRQPDAPARARYLWIMLMAGALCFAWLSGYDWFAQTANRWTFKRDYILNNHWTPRGASTVWILGMIGVLMAVFYYLAEVRRVRLTWLVTLGRTALVLYFLHQLIVLTLVNQRLGMRFNDWWLYGLANLVLMGVLLGIGRLWLDLRRDARSLLAATPVRSLLFSFHGRVPRSGFWLVQICSAAVGSVATVLVVRVSSGAAAIATPVLLVVLVLVLASLVALLTIWVNLAVLARRWHDRGRSGWMGWLLLLPVVGAIWSLIELGFLKGTSGPNRYGEDPLRTSAEIEGSPGPGRPSSPPSTGRAEPGIVGEARS
jgi:uncharacterized membrane protein YhaH (DUF805 family)/uncharacterized membrane protein